jgi:hypothetical protein
LVVRGAFFLADWDFEAAALARAIVVVLKIIGFAMPGSVPIHQKILQYGESFKKLVLTVR